MASTHRIPPPDRGLVVLERLRQLHESRPHRDEPGTLGEQLGAIELYLADPMRSSDPDGAWAIARRLAIPHARRRSDAA